MKIWANKSTISMLTW